MLNKIVPDDLYLDYTEAGLELNLQSHHGDAVVVVIEGASFGHLVSSLFASYGVHFEDGDEEDCSECDQEALPF